MPTRDTDTEKRSGAFYDSAYGERRKRRHRKGRTRMNVLMGILLVLLLVWLFLPNPSAPTPSDPSERTRSFPAAEANEAVGNAPVSNNVSGSIPPEAVAPNPMLELYIDQELREGPYRFEVTYPNNEALLSEQGDGTHLFRLSGKVYTEEEEIALPFRVHFFSNRPEEYESFQPIFTEDLSFQVEGDHFVFQLSHPEALDPGLYYYLIEESKTGEVYGVGKVSVGS